MKKLICYPSVVIKGQSFKGKKKVTIPAQSMKLSEIIRRFVKREPLPAEREGVYDDRHDYDLEKLAKADRTIQEEVLEEVKATVKRRRKVAEDMLKAAKESPPKQEDPKDSSPKQP